MVLHLGGVILKDKWTLGPKFREYVLLNFRMVRLQLFMAAILSLTDVTLWVAGLFLGTALARLYSTTLYHQQASLYQSVPVSAFETVLTKISLGSAGVVFPIAFYLKNWSLLQTLQHIMLAVLICGIVLFGVAVGNRMRGNREKKPNAATAIFAIAGMVLAVLGIRWILQQIQFADPAVQQWVGLVLSMLGAAGMFWANVYALERWYSI